jgi:hypothetical protein
MGKREVVIVGSGPSALIAAEACERMKANFVIFAAPGMNGEPMKSKLGGAQFLHQPIPGFTFAQPEIHVRYEMLGTAEEYQRKVYGEEMQGAMASAHHIAQGLEQPAWNLRHWYELLYQKWAADILPKALTAANVEMMVDNGHLVFSTIPAPKLCVNLAHQFKSQKVWILNDPAWQVAPGTVVYNGQREPAWYRASNLFGTASVEYPERSKPPIPGLMAVEKPLFTNCTCLPAVVRLGRFGQWKKGVLVNHAWDEVINALQ